MKLLLLNQNWFAEEFRAAGHDVLIAGINREFELRLETPLLHIDTVLQAAPRPFVPDAIVVYDESSPWHIAGLDETDYPVLFYSVDTHHHAKVHRFLSHMADHTFVAQKDFAGPFAEVDQHPEWLPLWAPRYVEPVKEKRWGTCFVGNLERSLNPQRVDFFEALRKRTEVFITRGQYWDYFPASEVVINQTVKGDLNFRVFEAMMCGAALLTERSGNGLLELFQEGQHLVTYEKHQVEDAVRRIEELRSNPSKRAQIAAQGREEVLAKHRPIHRAEVLLARLASLRRGQSSMRHIGAMVNFSCYGNLMADREPGLAGRALLLALKAAEQALAIREKLSNDAICSLIRAALQYDRIMSVNAGDVLLAQYAEAYPETPILALARVRSLLNSGNRSDAEAMAQKYFKVSPENVFITAERMILELMDPA